jgi:hypothetical protein
MDEITCVKLGDGQQACFFCGIPVDKGWPVVERRWYHAGGETERMGCGRRAGEVVACAHVQCAWRLDTASDTRACAICKTPTEPGNRLVNFIGSRKKRATPPAEDSAAGLHWCFPCTAIFVAKHQALLDGHLSAQQQQQGVAWNRTLPAFGAPADLQEGCGLPVLLASSKAELLRIFRGSSMEMEARAVERHRELQSMILDAMRTDKLLEADTKRRRDTPVERKFSKRVRVAEGTPVGRVPVLRQLRSRSRSPYAGSADKQMQDTYVA